MNNINKYISPNKFTILVGKNCIANDYLTFKIAQPNDIWLHVSDYSGSHVIIETNNNDIQKEDIIFAGKLAAKYSKAPIGKVYIDVCYQKDVYKPKKASHGEVKISNEYQISVFKE